MATNKNLTWDELANDYDSYLSIFKARTLPIEDILDGQKSRTKSMKLQKLELFAIESKEEKDSAKI